MTPVCWKELKAYKREKSRLFNANLRELRLKDKANQLFQKVEPKVEPNKRQDDNQDNLQDNLQDDVLESFPAHWTGRRFTRSSPT